MHLLALPEICYNSLSLIWRQCPFLFHKYLLFPPREQLKMGILLLDVLPPALSVLEDNLLALECLSSQLFLLHHEEALIPLVVSALLGQVSLQGLLLRFCQAHPETFVKEMVALILMLLLLMVPCYIVFSFILNLSSKLSMVIILLQDTAFFL